MSIEERKIKKELESIENIENSSIELKTKEESANELKNGNELNDCVLDYYIDRKYSNPDELIRDMEDLQRYGCVSGMITDLIYYDDTNKFYDNYKDDINELLSNLLDESGLSIQEFFGKNFDNDDPLILNFSKYSSTI